MHKLAIAIWHVLHDKVPYRELGADYFAKRDPERAMRRMIKEANNGRAISFWQQAQRQAAHSSGCLACRSAWW
ncbi:hypothetical protein AB0D37_39735 [Streptomyces sp. NPDC048384]|uniref:hypothetical protein n=1 Tax=Streptomyces sp. NPDC048384 TaxID=3155487 RepID=UPI00343BAD8B